MRGQQAGLFPPSVTATLPSPMVSNPTLGGGAPSDRPWGRTFAGFSNDRLSGQIELAEGERSFVVAFAAGTIVGARSPLATDAAVRVARLANLISPGQVSSFVHAYGSSPKADDIELLIAHAKLRPEQAADLRRKVIAHRAARTFSVEVAVHKVEPVSIEVIPGCELDPRAIIYQGARHNLTEKRLTGELGRMGSWFRIKPGIDPAVYGFGDAERALLDRLRDGGSLAELESAAPGIDVRMVRGALYALCATDACDIRPTAPHASIVTEPAKDLVGLVAPKLVDLPEPRGELAPRAPAQSDDLLAPKDRERNDTVVDGPSRVDLVGMIVDGRYVINRKVGDGAMGSVYLSHHTKLDRLFAVKVLHRRLLGSGSSQRRFEREAELTSRLSHHNVVRVVDTGTVSGLPYLAMEFVEGTSLATILVDAPLPQERALHLLRQLCAGLQHAHDAGLVHRDLRPSNILVDSSGEEELLRIVDFGIAILDDPDGGDRLTTRGVMLGTPDYMAPELALGSAIDHRLDLYALGVIAFEMFAGVKPFAGDGVDVALASVNQPVPAMATRAPGVAVDPVVEALIRTLLAKSPADRPASAQAVRKQIDLIEGDRRAAATALGVTLDPPIIVETREPIAPAEERTVKTRAMWKLERSPLATGSDPIPVVSETTAPATAAVAAVSEPTRTEDVAVPRTRSRDDYDTDEIRPVRRTGLYIGLAVAVGLIVFVIIMMTRPLAKQDAPVEPTKPVVVAPSPPAPVASKLEGSAVVVAAKPDTSAAGISTLYKAVGAELAGLERAIGRNLTADLVRRYRMLMLPPMVQTPARRTAAHEVLTQLRRDIAALRR